MLLARRLQIVICSRSVEQKKKNIEWKYVMLRKDNVELSTTQRQERYLRVVNDPA